MPKFNVSGNNIEFLMEKEIEAKDQEEAIGIYYEMWHAGEIGVGDSDLDSVEAKLIE